MKPRPKSTLLNPEDRVDERLRGFPVGPLRKALRLMLEAAYLDGAAAVSGCVTSARLNYKNLEVVDRCLVEELLWHRERLREEEGP